MIESSFPEVLTLAEAARLLRMSKAHLSNLLNGRIPGIVPPPHARVGRRVLFRRESLGAWLRDVEATGDSAGVLTLPNLR